ncbi:uncharacterized protein LOC123564743 [Mercenaria mercenaria]|uniref:uncharacterized protein LOC123564743 n=1 Tax=Mercenaria mercenaria TaxID=6596 RepID=UPI001E1D56BC|nr:uncharacterized protein LOC123564743 [Mercenaria mercenaria]
MNKPEHSKVYLILGMHFCHHGIDLKSFTGILNNNSPSMCNKLDKLKRGPPKDVKENDKVCHYAWTMSDHNDCCVTSWANSREVHPKMLKKMIKFAIMRGQCQTTMTAGVMLH